MLILYVPIFDEIALLYVSLKETYAEEHRWLIVPTESFVRMITAYVYMNKYILPFENILVSLYDQNVW